MSEDADRAAEDLSPETPNEPVEGGTFGFRQALEKVREFPQTPGIYLMKDGAGRVIYVGKAKNLRARAISYFLKAAAEDRRTSELVREIAHIHFIAAESEAYALLAEARLTKE